MRIEKRIDQYKAIEVARGRPLIIYATSTRQNVAARMAGDAIREFIDQIDAIEGEDAVDVLIHSTGGDGLTAWKLMSLLRGRFSKVGVIVPFQAFSAATIFALGADEIIMHPHASLGPIDPQISVQQPDGSTLQFAYEDVGAFLQFITEDGKLTEQAHVVSIIENLLSIASPLAIGAAKRASDLSSDMGARMLAMHMSSTDEMSQVSSIADNLNKSFFAHADAIPRDRARELGLRISKSNEEIEELIWQAYLNIEEYMKLRQPHNELHVFLGDPTAASSLVPLAPVNLPANIPANIQNQVWTAVVQNAQAAAQQAGIEVPFSIVNAIVESPRRASEFRSEGKVSAVRIGGQIQMSRISTQAEWREVAISKPKSKKATTKKATAKKATAKKATAKKATAKKATAKKATAKKATTKKATAKKATAKKKVAASVSTKT